MQRATIGSIAAKGISAIPAVTIHATGAFSRENWERDRDEVAKELIDAAEPWLGTASTGYEVHHWRFSKPVRVDPERCVVAVDAPPLVFAGDAFGDPRVEGAALSGWAAAEVLATRLS